MEDYLNGLESWLRQIIRTEVDSAIQANKQKEQPEKHFSRDEVCKMLDITLPTLWKLTKEGKIKAIHIGRRVVYSETEVKRLTK